MTILGKNYKNALQTYELLSQYEKDQSLINPVGQGLEIIFVLSQSYPVEDLSDFFDGSNFSMTEAHHEFEASYEITKLGFFKQGLMSLRTGFEIGVLSTYWSVIGKGDRTFSNWLKAREKTPFSRDIQKKLLTNKNIGTFDKKYPIKSFFKDLEVLHNYVHTKGVPYSNFGELQKLMRKEESSETLFDRWLEIFKRCLQLVVILHLLRFPIASLNYNFVKKFGTTNKSPFCGGLFGDYQEHLTYFVGEDKLNFIQEIANHDEKTIGLLQWLNSHPDLSPEEIDRIVSEEQAEEQKEREKYEEVLRQRNLRVD